MGKRKTHRFEVFVAVLVIAALGLIGCGQESSGVLSPNALNNCAGEPDTDLDGICDKFDPDVNNPDLDDNNVLDGSQLGSLPTSTGGSGSVGPGSVQPSGSGASTGNQLLTLAALAVLPRGSAGVSKFIGDTVFPDDDGSGSSSSGGTSQPSGSPSGTGGGGQAPVPESGGLQRPADVAPKAASFTHTRDKVQSGQSLNPFINVREDESFFYAVPVQGENCPNVANWALITYVVLDYSDNGLTPMTHEFVSILLAKLPEQYANPETEVVKNVGAWQHYKNELSRLWINPGKRTYENAKDVIDNVRNRQMTGLEQCNATGYYYSTAQQGTDKEWDVADETFFGFTFDKASGLFVQETLTPFKLAFDPTQLDVFLNPPQGAGPEADEQPIQMATYIDPDVPTFWNRSLPLPANFEITAPWHGEWSRPIFE